MALVYNGTNIPNLGGQVIYNGTDLDKVYCNGTLVWEKYTGPVSASFTIGQELFEDIEADGEQRSTGYPLVLNNNTIQYLEYDDVKHEFEEGDYYFYTLSGLSALVECNYRNFTINVGAANKGSTVKLKCWVTSDLGLDLDYNREVSKTPVLYEVSGVVDDSGNVTLITPGVSFRIHPHTKYVEYAYYPAEDDTSDTTDADYFVMNDGNFFIYKNESDAPYGSGRIKNYVYVHLQFSITRAGITKYSNDLVQTNQGAERTTVFTFN